MEFFVDKDSVVRKIWGKGDTVLLIFAGAAAEFALNKAVDWLYFTGRLPADPLRRLFSTVSYARQIVFSKMGDANRAIDRITAIHGAVEANRGAIYRSFGRTIPHYICRKCISAILRGNHRKVAASCKIQFVNAPTYAT